MIETIINALPSNALSFYYRTSAGAEIDLLIEFGLNNYWAVEIKASRTPTLSKGFQIACEDLKVKEKFVVYPGEDTFSIANNITVLPLSHFIEIKKKRLVTLARQRFSLKELYYATQNRLECSLLAASLWRAKL